MGGAVLGASLLLSEGCLVFLRTRWPIDAGFHRQAQAKRVAKVGAVLGDPVREDAAMKPLGVIETRHGARL